MGDGIAEVGGRHVVRMFAAYRDHAEGVHVFVHDYDLGRSLHDLEWKEAEDRHAREARRQAVSGGIVDAAFVE